ncbi:MAG: 50S ribosomal protein L7/L12 [Oscillospiraceae bacterium]|jgi:large subunit ribosomal protein L7/L12|nr:50S ribosomal protein L7/L12 [Oscillospiraceae bacterium]
MSEKITQIVDMIAEMTVIELSEVVKAIEERFNVSAAAPVAQVVAGPAAEVEEKTSFDVVLVNDGGAKMNVIKAIRTITALGLKEAKEFVEGAPKTVKEGVTKEDAEAVAAQLKEAGATVEIK